MMKLFLLCLCFLFSSNSQAFDALAIYNKTLNDKDTGIYEESGYLFFVINQPCLTNKKYAGTKESKAAEKVFYVLLNKAKNSYNLSFDKASIQFGKELQTEIYNIISKNENPLSKITHKLIIDRNSKSRECTREYVKISSLDNFGKNKVKISTSQALNIAAILLLKAIEKNDYAKISNYLADFHLPSLAKLYEIKREKESYPFNLAYGDNVTLKDISLNNKYLTPPPTPFNKYDINSVIALALKEKGLIKIKTLHPNIELSNDFLSMAESDFKQGINPNNIIKNLILSINLNNQNSDAWKLLSSIYRALQKNTEALTMVNQYVIQSDENQIESWVYLLKALQKTAPQEAKKLHALLALMSNNISLTKWAKAQIKDYQ